MAFRSRAYVGLLAFLSVGCAAGPDVVRVYDGRIAVEKFVPEEAYAVFLAGTLADASGRPSEALHQFERLAKIDGGDALVWTRIGDLRCRLGMAGASVDDAYERALSMDATYAGALAGRARCLLDRGAVQKAATWCQKALAEDPTNVGIAAGLLRAEGRLASRPEGRARAIELTVAHGNDAEAWEALAAWGRVRFDAELHARGLAGLLRTAPARRAEVEEGIRWLNGRGELDRARELAGRLFDVASERDMPGPRDPLGARLAVDDALSRRDDGLAASRAVRGRVSRAELAARALAFDGDGVAERIASEVLAADEGAGGARMVLAAIAGRGRAVEPDLHRATDVAPLYCALVVARRLAFLRGPEAARAWLVSVEHGPVLAGDPLVEEALVDLAARGVVEESLLSTGPRLELALRRGMRPPPDTTEGPRDARHELLWLALTSPKALATLAFARSFSSATDPVVALARSYILAAPVGRQAVVEALRRWPTQPLLLARAVVLTGGSSPEASELRERLRAVAATDKEKALATDARVSSPI